MNRLSPDLAVSRILDALEHEIMAMPEEEIVAVLRELGMQPGMAGSAALADIRYATLRRMLDPAERAHDAQEPDEHENRETNRIPPWIRR